MPGKTAAAHPSAPPLVVAEKQFADDGGPVPVEVVVRSRRVCPDRGHVYAHPAGGGALWCVARGDKTLTYVPSLFGPRSADNTVKLAGAKEPTYVAPWRVRKNSLAAQQPATAAAAAAAATGDEDATVLYVADTQASCLHVVTPDGAALRCLGRQDTAPISRQLISGPLEGSDAAPRGPERVQPLRLPRTRHDLCRQRQTRRRLGRRD